MSDERKKPHPDENPKSENQRTNQTRDWSHIARGVLHDSIFGGYASNFFMGVVFLLIGPAVAIYFFRTPTAAIIGAIIGVF